MKRKQFLSALLALALVMTSSSVVSAGELTELGSGESDTLSVVGEFEEDESESLLDTVTILDEETSDEEISEDSQFEDLMSEDAAVEKEEDYDIRMIEEFAKIATDLPQEDPVPSVEGADCVDEGLLNSSEDVNVNGVTLPAKYTFNKSEMMPVRNQNPYGTCWTFATLACLEMSAVKQGLATADKIDFSEHHLEYYTSSSVVDPLKGTQDDFNLYRGDNKQRAAMGGNMSMACNVLFNWNGCAEEKDFPYSDVLKSLPGDVANAYGKDVFHAATSRIYNKKDTNLIKQAVMKSGIVAISMRLEQSSYYNVKNCCHYLPGTANANHAVAIVGWDDNYDRNNFYPAKPSNNGAWLVRNSWGSTWGDNGYFWLSYEDGSIGANVYEVSVEPVDKYNNNYQYDGGIYDNYFSTNISAKVAQEANVFTAKANAGGAEYLEAVSFSTYNTNVKYDVQIYLEPNSKNPASGVKCFGNPISGVISTPGRYQVVLPSKIYLKEGTKYAVVVTYYRNSDYLVVAREVSSTADGGRFISQVGLQEGQSYSSFDGYWREETRGNYRVKAYTNNTARDIAKEKELEKKLEGEPVPFPDVAKNSWMHKAVQYVYNHNIMQGIKNSKGVLDFKPGDNVSRAQVATILYNATGKPSYGYIRFFEDVAPGKYFSEPVTWAYLKNVINGKGNGTFDPNGDVTRQELAVMLYNYSVYVTRDSRGSRNLTGFADSGRVASWARNAMMWAVGNGIIGGKSKNGQMYLDPTGTATRAECAQMIMKMGLGQ